jgi:hypothetical protein
MHEGQVTPGIAPLLRGAKWLVRHYYASVYDRMALAGQRPAAEMLNRQERRRRFVTNERHRLALDAMKGMAAPHMYGGAAERNVYKAHRRAVRAAGGQA